MKLDKHRIIQESFTTVHENCVTVQDHFLSKTFQSINQLINFICHNNTLQTAKCTKENLYMVWQVIPQSINI